MEPANGDGHFKFPVNTSSNCFFCFENVFSKNRKCSLENIFRYLKIDLSQIKSLAAKSTSPLDKTDVKVQVSLCLGCWKEMKTFSEQYKVMELARVRLQSSLEAIGRKMHNLNDHPNRMESYQKKILETEEIQALMHSEIVEELRDEVMKKCKDKTQTLKPNVTEKVVINPRRSSTRSDLINVDNLSTSTEEEDEGPEVVVKLEEDEAEDEGECGNPNLDDNDDVLEDMEEPNSILPDDDDEDEDEDDQRIFKEELESEDEEITSQIQNNEEPVDVNFLEEEYEEPEEDSTEEIQQQSSICTYFKNPETGTFDCPSCGKGFTQSGNAHRHYCKIHLKKKHKCSHCKVNFSTISKLNAHEQKCDGKGSISSIGYIKNSKTGRFGCSACNMSFSQSGNAKRHYESIHLQKTHECDICGGSFSQIGNLQKHKKICNAAAAASNNGDGMKETSSLRIRIKGKKQNEYYVKDLATATYNCTACDKRLQSSSQAVVHYEAIHLKKRWKCNICNEIDFSQQSNLLSHQKKCRNRKSKAVPDKRTDPEGEIQQQNQISSTDSSSLPIPHQKKAPKSQKALMKRKFVCELCNKRFHTAGNLEDHKDGVHFRTIYNCSNCKKSFRGRPTFRMHERKCRREVITAEKGAA